MLNALAPRPSQPSNIIPYGHMSLWDMLDHRATSLVRCYGILRTALDRMLKSPDDKTDASSLEATLGMVAEECERSGLPVSKAMAAEYASIASNAYDNAIMAPKIEAIMEAIEGELRTIKLFRVRTEYIRFVTERPLFHTSVYDKFPTAIRDIEDGGKSLGYELGTACVFHMMRVMEVGLKALGNALGIPYAPTWESYLRQIEAKITAQHKTKGIKWKRDEAYFR